MKSRRHETILDIISKYPIETQDELIMQLRAEGYRVTQSTISRDIKDLRLVKTLAGDGKYRYTSAEKNDTDIRSNFENLFSTSVSSLDYAQNIVVVKTLSGMAQAVCAALDSNRHKFIVGTIAGDDTIMCAIRTVEETHSLMKKIRKIVES